MRSCHVGVAFLKGEEEGGAGDDALDDRVNASKFDYSEASGF